MMVDRFYNVPFPCTGNAARSMLATDEAASLCPASTVLLRREVEA